MPYIGKRLLQVITDKRLNEHPIFFHVFSNGGAVLYQHVSLAMQRTNTPLKVRAAVIATVFLGEVIQSIQLCD